MNDGNDFAYSSFARLLLLFTSSCFSFCLLCTVHHNNTVVRCLYVFLRSTLHTVIAAGAAAVASGYRLGSVSDTSCQSTHVPHSWQQQ
jgi:hypothetical protein